MKPFPSRIVIHSKDVALLTGISQRSARRTLYQVRKHFNKPARSLVSIEEFCGFTKMNKKEVSEFLEK